MIDPNQRQIRWEDAGRYRSQRPRRSLGLFLRLLFLLMLCGLGPQLVQIGRSRSQIHNQIETVPLTQHAIVFGAAVIDENTLTDVTRERVEAATLLYWQGKARYLFISGDDRQSEQAQAMARYAIARGVPEAQVIIDPIGIDTHDTCRHFLQVGKKAILVTQGFHLPRALLMCERQGIDVTGLAANQLELLDSRGSSELEIAWIRTYRWLREAGLTGMYLIGIYDRLSNEAEQIETGSQ